MFWKEKNVFQNMNFDLREGYTLSSFLMNSLEALDVDGTRIASIDLLVPRYLQNDFCNIVDELTGTKRKHDDDIFNHLSWIPILAKNKFQHIVFQEVEF